MTYKVFRYVNGRNKSKRAWTIVEATSEVEAIQTAATKKGVTLVWAKPEVGGFTTTPRWMDEDDRKVSFGAVKS